MKQLSSLLILLTASAVFSFSQAQTWTVGASGGLLNYYGDVTEYSTFNPAASRPAGALSIETRFAKFLRPQLQLMGGQIRGEKEYLDVQLNSLHLEAALKLGFDVMALINASSKFEISPNIAFVGAYYNPEVTRISTNELVVAPHVNQGQRFGTGLGWGGRLGYDLNSKWRVMAGLDMRYYLTNEIDGFDGTRSTSNDWLSYFYAGVGYSFGSASKIADVEGAPDPKRLFAGNYTYNNLPKSGVTLELYDEDDNMLSTAITDASGDFQFPGLKEGKEYTVKLAEMNEDLAPGTKVYRINEAGEKVGIATKKGNNRFVYTHIPQEDANALAAIEVDDSETVSQGVFTYKKLPKGGVKLNLYDASGVKVASTITDIAGKFKFQGLSPDQNYVIKLNEDDEDMFSQGKIYLTNSSGQRVVAASRPLFNEYKFSHLGADQRDALPILEESDSETKMRGVFTYNDLPKAGVKLYLVNEKDAKVDSVVTGVDGSFQFSDLSPNKAYMLKLAEGMVDNSEGIDIYFVNAEKEPVMRAGTERNGKYSFEAMTEDDMGTLQVLHAEVAGEGKMLKRREMIDGEYVLESTDGTKTIEGFELVGDSPDSKDKPRDPKEALYNVSFEKETIFFGHNKFSIDQDQNNSKGSVIAKKLKANPAMRIEVQGYASQPGTEAYNLLLSQRRADELKRLLVDKYGIDPGRIVAVGKGEDPAVDEQEACRARIIILE